MESNPERCVVREAPLHPPLHWVVAPEYARGAGSAAGLSLHRDRQAGAEDPRIRDGGCSAGTTQVRGGCDHSSQRSCCTLVLHSFQTS